MDNALSMGKTSALGSLQLFLGKMLSTVILAVGTIILTILISEGDYGIYVVALVPAATALLFQDWGVGAAITRYCAKYRATNQEGELRRTIVAGLTFEVSTALVLTLISVSIASFVASSLFNKPESVLPMTLASITVFSTAILAVSQSIFVGFERMAFTSYTLVCQAIVQCFVAPLLVSLGFGAIGATIGYSVASIVGASIAISIVYFKIFRKLDAEKSVQSSISQTLRPMLGYGVPLAIASLLAGIMTQFLSFMIASYADNVMIGNYGIAVNFAVLLTFFTIPISTVLFPAFSKVDASGDPQLLKTVFSSSIKYTALLLVPAAMAIMVLSGQLIGTIYGDKWLYASFFLTLYAMNYVILIFGGLSNNSALIGLGATRVLLKLNAITIFVGVPLGFLVIPVFGIPGAIVVNVVAGLPSIFVGLYWSWKKYGLKADYKAGAKIFLSSGIAAFVTFLFVAFFSFAAWVMFFAGVLIFLLVYLTAAPLIGAINQTDINNLRAMFSSLGVVSKLLEIPLKFAEKPLALRSSLVETNES